MLKAIGSAINILFTIVGLGIAAAISFAYLGAQGTLLLIIALAMLYIIVALSEILKLLRAILAAQQTRAGG